MLSMRNMRYEMYDNDDDSVAHHWLPVASNNSSSSRLDYLDWCGCQPLQSFKHNSNI